MVYTEDSIVRNIPTMKFVVEDKEFANASINPWNAGFCTPLNHCIPSGLINCTSMGHGMRHTPSIAFRHLPPNSARFSYATEGVLFICAQLSTVAA